MRTRRSAADQLPADELFRSRLENQIDLRHPLAQLSHRLPWAALEHALSPRLPATCAAGGRPGLPVRLIAGLLYLKHAYDLSDEALCERWLENPYWQFFTGEVVFQTCLPCAPSSLTRWRQRLGEAGMEELLAHTINTAHAIKAVDARELSRVIVDTTVQEKAIAHPTDSRLLEVARKKLVLLAKRHGIALQQTYARQGPALSRKAGRYAHARQFKRMRKVLRRQRTILGRVMRGLQRAVDTLKTSVRERIGVWLERAQRLYTQRPKDKQKLYALHAPEVECMSKGKARIPYEFGVKVGIAVSARKGLIVGARSFPGNPYDGDTLAEQLEQTRGLLQDVNVIPQVAIVDLGYRGREVAGVKVLHRGKAKTLTRRQWGWIKRRQAVEPVIGHLKQDCRLNRCRLKGAQGDALHVLGCAAGYNLRWLMRWIALLRAWLRAMLARSSTPSSTLWPAMMPIGA
ncbi:IS5/IS1182 family transposase [Xanthomonas cucurbitae]|uniref:IS5/IS1182 family transposase n=1 Tax=Xanthomonas cucurbitae TaxID=56453 RepID=A0A2S7DDZ2_9XANT|nr:IS5 family transposase [Xanthomonas cucurbitae]PPU71944.1 IS5/IS1182 family transposase [Xanthomonas cucurbitae]WDM77532.1 IS5 family transposase [Xanthomonas cucurbitae]WDM81208.1 IS5 family transposase [Xanthomonas cucurbitae]